MFFRHTREESADGLFFTVITIRSICPLVLPGQSNRKVPEVRSAASSARWNPPFSFSGSWLQLWVSAASSCYHSNYGSRQFYFLHWHYRFLLCKDYTSGLGWTTGEAFEADLHTSCRNTSSGSIQSGVRRCSWWCWIVTIDFQSVYDRIKNSLTIMGFFPLRRNI